MVKVLFVCLGNICRSPMAEGLFAKKVKEAGLEDRIEIDSCGTGAWHVGERPDKRMLETAQSHDVYLPSRARKVELSDFQEFDLIVAMDQNNLKDLQKLANQLVGEHGELLKMRDFDVLAKGADVPDPYYGGLSGFEDVYQMLDRSTDELLSYIENNYSLEKS
ncbi:low molecular weight protein-tyrosine-phosphatase [Pontibacter sp. G13]|uniref:low molecular weight protein-tyrosine-phosphatase n=1 Tax=Pontibacter sp. G13 TaxID=3074898 RepID=UPI00288BC433|nr:low molecular weight protein-tyrosine-phosphatase [Pontibacter sp. G13]WNJ21528.1 low molecular weight protein-tyrosine-phosphatase [Pontibacter sp. G13]